MLTTVWTYPWDLNDLGADTVLDEVLNRAGAGGISLAASYHDGHFLQPRSPRRKVYFPEVGTLYFAHDPERYRSLRVQPREASLVVREGDPFRLLAEARDRRSFRLNAWVVCLHNSRVGFAHPELTAENAWGDRHPYALCPSQPDVRAYVTTMLRDLTERYPIDAVELESVGYMGFFHEYHHEKDGVGLSRLENFLFSLCFCPACRSTALKEGVDAERCRRTVRTWIEEACARETPAADAGFLTRGVEGFRGDPDLHQFILWRMKPVTELVAAIREAVPARTHLHLLSGDPRHGWTTGLDIAALLDSVDGLVTLAYNRLPAEAGTDLFEARQMIGADKYLGAGLRLFYPEVQSAEALAAVMVALARAGADGLHIYNYGLVPGARLDWVRHGLERVGAL